MDHRHTLYDEKSYDEKHHRDNYDNYDYDERDATHLLPVLFFEHCFVQHVDLLQRANERHAAGDAQQHGNHAAVSLGDLYN